MSIHESSRSQLFSGQQTFERERNIKNDLQAMLACTDGVIEASEGEDLASVLGESLNVSPVEIMNVLKRSVFEGNIGYSVGPPQDPSALTGPLVRVCIIPPQETHDA
jgi:hypothetical protein